MSDQKCMWCDEYGECECRPKPSPTYFPDDWQARRFEAKLDLPVESIAIESKRNE